MASSRFFHLSSAFLRLRRKSNRFALSALPLPLSPSPPHRLFHSGRFPALQIRRLQFFFSTSAAALDSVEAATSAHPWPEWGQFVEKIRSKGYFEIVASEAVDDEGEALTVCRTPALGDKGIALDINRLKNACLKFARERFDILRSLPKEDIRAIVECGCPNIFRKSVNSAKRLRAFLRLDEADVCCACNLRASCDRAYKTVHEEEGARTVDIMRVLLSYAVNPAALLGGENSPVKVQVQDSARKLLSEFTNLSDTIIDPALPKPILNIITQKEASSQLKTTTNKKKNTQDVEMKKGDWLCPNCNFLNFARNVRCLECKVDGPNKVDSDAMKMKPGDWSCPKCNFMNFARNRKCFRCLEERPKRDLNPGDWECPECDFLNFSRNQVCRRCNRDRPGEGGSESKDHIWRKPGNSREIKDFMFGESEEEKTDSEDDIAREEDHDDNDDDVWPHAPAKRNLASARKRNIMKNDG
ncbi:zinc finger protein VAR3, chloroplastic [Dendrobium catenatum]|uniref:Zinc finger protein VAR3, chloroplastic n=1 Tax=Dendrobium catenatum TaxID=906689 RepID=A0A2I0WK20_9ASPA|nr:zinc finger protein VAR3, chloroplastic [Dendrobium catenatum]PKU76001.1 Zinc finger protein VAR3, chloroplastic [Dendrobium catenatum]